ncbi:MAG: restriction endonuclease subunit S [Bacteroidota bacterium]
MKEVRLIDICEVIAGQSPPSSTYNQDQDGIPFFQGKADFGELFPNVRYWCNAPKKLSMPNDILFSLRAPVGPTNINNIEACIGRGLAAIRCHGVDLKYLLHFLRANEKRIAMLGTGSTFKAITIGTLKDLKIPLPPLPQQKKIASILDAADAYRQQTRALIGKYEELSQSLFLEMFGDPVTNPKGWNYTPLDKILEFLTSGSRGWAKYYSESGSIFLRIQNVGYNELRLDDLTYVNAPESAESRRTLVKSGDVLLTITADLGRTAVIPTNFPTANINQHLALLRLNEDYNPTFVSSYIASNGGQSLFLKLDKGGVKAGLNFNDIKSYKLFSVPKDLQDKFEKRLRAIEAQKAQAEASLAQAEELFQALLQKAFKGELV